MTLRTSAHTVGTPHAVVGAAALAALSSTNNLKAVISPGATVSPHRRRVDTSPHATAAQKVGFASAGRTLQTTAKKGFTGTREHGAPKTSGKKLVVVNDKAMAKKDGSNDNGHHGTLRVAHSTTVQRNKHIAVAGVRRATANGGWTRHAA